MEKQQDIFSILITCSVNICSIANEKPKNLLRQRVLPIRCQEGRIEHNKTRKQGAWYVLSVKQDITLSKQLRGMTASFPLVFKAARKIKTIFAT
jgi:hypothetical protein